MDQIMEKKPEVCVIAVLLPTGRITCGGNEAMIDALSHPATRLGVMVFYGQYMYRRATSHHPCPTCGQEVWSSSHTEWGFHEQDVLFVCDGDVFVVYNTAAYSEVDMYGRPYKKSIWKLTGERRASVLANDKRVQWVLNDWLERNT
jgi:hypothetical protein